MNNIFSFFTLLILLIDFGSAQSPIKEMHTGKNSLSWEGIYTGILPCADCPGIETSVTLNSGNSFTISTRYLERQDTVYTQRGTFSWSSDGTTVILDNDRNAPAQYFVGENVLIQLDMEGNRIAGPLAEKFILRKINSSIAGRRWRLIELMGASAVDTTMKRHEIFFQLDSGERRISGFAGCNRFFGHYELNVGNRIHFSAVGSTLMACPFMEIESEFLDMLQKVDNYTLKGGKLQLNKARMAPLAVFVEMK